MKKYRVSHSELTAARPEDVWALWSDINHWPEWDEGLDTAAAAAGLETGKTLLLKPKGAPATVEVKLIDVKPGQYFIDETRLPFGVIRASHLMEQAGDKTRLTHTIEAEIKPEQAQFFEQAIWSGMERGLAKSVRNLEKLARERNKPKS